MADILQELREPLPKVEGYSGEYVDEDVVADLFRDAANEIERLREDNDTLQRMLKMAATWTAEPGVTIAEIREVFSLLDRAALGEKE